MGGGISSLSFCHEQEDDITRGVRIALEKASRNDPKVTQLDLLRVRRSPKLFRQLAAVLRANSVIRCVRLPARTRNDEFLPIAESLNQNSSVKVVHLLCCNIAGSEGGEIVQTLLLRNNRIADISLSGNFCLGAEGAAGIARALLRRGDHRCALKKIDLCYCGIRNDGVRDLSNALRHNDVVVEELNVRNNQITIVGFQHVAAMLQINSSLKVLVLGSNRLDQDRVGHETAGDILAPALRKNASLHELNISSCHLSGADISSVLRALAGSNNQTLSRLHLHNNRMDEAAMTKLSLVLPDLTGIKKLVFPWCQRVSLPILHGVLKGLRSNKSLLHIRAICAFGMTGPPELWHTQAEFVARRNQIRIILEGRSEAVAIGEGVVPPLRPVPQSLWPHVLEWCNGRNVSAEAKASLIHHVFNDILGIDDHIRRTIYNENQG